MTDTPTTINLYGIEPSDMPQEHADLVAQALGLRGAERWDCGHDYGWWMPQGKLIVTRVRQDAKHANVRCVTTSELVELIFTEGARLRAEVEALREDLRYAEAALSDIGDAEREPGDDLAWCERRAAKALPRVRAAIDAGRTPEGRSDG